jgi:hypothetical protein
VHDMGPALSHRHRCVRPRLGAWRPRGAAPPLVRIRVRGRSVARVVEQGCALVHRHAIAPALRELASLGFIEITEEGRAGNRDFYTPALAVLHHGGIETTSITRKTPLIPAKVIGKWL